MKINFEGDLTAELKKVADDVEIIPEGIYEAIITDIEEAQSKSGDPMLVVTVKPKGHKSNLKGWVVIRSDILFVLKAFQLSTGLEIIDNELQLEDLFGRKCRISVKHTESGGSTYANIKSWLKPLKQSKPAKEAPQDVEFRDDTES
jgi:hypothetical protein